MKSDDTNDLATVPSVLQFRKKLGSVPVKLFWTTLESKFFPILNTSVPIICIHNSFSIQQRIAEWSWNRQKDQQQQKHLVPSYIYRYFCTWINLPSLWQSQRHSPWYHADHGSSQAVNALSVTHITRCIYHRQQSVRNNPPSPKINLFIYWRPRPNSQTDNLHWTQNESNFRHFPQVFHSHFQPLFARCPGCLRPINHHNRKTEEFSP